MALELEAFWVIKGSISSKSQQSILSFPIIFRAPVIAVDTHVFRVSHRLGLSEGRNPLEVENDLNRIIPEEKRADAHHWLILHGRYVCKALKPDCGNCGLSSWCPEFAKSSTPCRK